MLLDASKGIDEKSEGWLNVSLQSTSSKVSVHIVTVILDLTVTNGHMYHWKELVSNIYIMRQEILEIMDIVKPY